MFSEVVLCLMTYSWNIYYLLILMMCLHFNLSHLFLPLNFPTVAYPLSPSLPRPEILFRFSLLRLRSSHAAPDSSLPLPLLTGLLQPEPPPSPPPPTALLTLLPHRRVQMEWVQMPARLGPPSFSSSWITTMRSWFRRSPTRKANSSS
jgi:hypothetical protein